MSVGGGDEKRDKACDDKDSGKTAHDRLLFQGMFPVYPKKEAVGHEVEATELCARLRMPNEYYPRLLRAYELIST